MASASAKLAKFSQKERNYVKGLVAKFIKVDGNEKTSIDKVLVKHGLYFTQRSCSRVFRHIVALVEKGSEKVVAALGIYKDDCECMGGMGSTFETTVYKEEYEDDTDDVTVSITVDIHPALVVRCIEALPEGLGEFSIGNLSALDGMSTERLEEITTVNVMNPTKCTRPGDDHQMFPVSITV